jgi:L-asparaginase / beta-aspartyl-peptidase
MPGRIGDTPLVGIATYADNQLGALSATGTGEVIMKAVLVYDILKKVDYENKSIQQAAQEACDNMLDRFKDDGGVIGLDKDGNVAIAFSSKQMSWAYQNATNIVHYGVNKNEFLQYDVEECKNKQCIK